MSGTASETEQSKPKRLWTNEDQMLSIQSHTPYTNLEEFPDSEITNPNGSFITVFQDVEEEPYLLDIPVTPDSNLDNVNDNNNAPLSPQFDFYNDINLDDCKVKAIISSPLLLRYLKMDETGQMRFINFETEIPGWMNETIPFLGKDRVTSTETPLEFEEQPFINPSTLNDEPITVPYLLMNEDIEAMPDFENNYDVVMTDEVPTNGDSDERMAPPEPLYWQDYTEDEIPIEDPEVWVVVDIEEDDTGETVEEENQQENAGNENDTEEPGYNDAEENENDGDMMEDDIEDDDDVVDDESVDDESVDESASNDDIQDDDVTTSSEMETSYNDAISEEDETSTVNDPRAWKKQFLDLLSQVLFDDDEEMIDQSNEVEPEPQEPAEVYPRVIVEHLPQFPPPPGVPIPTNFWTPEFF